METITNTNELDAKDNALFVDENLDSFNADNLQQNQEQLAAKPRFNIKKRLPLIIAVVVLLPIVILYATSIISTLVFSSILLGVISLASILVVLVLIKNMRAKKGIKKWIIMLAKLLPMIPLLSLYLTNIIPTTLFIILKAAMAGIFIIFTITMLVVNKLRVKKDK